MYVCYLVSVATANDVSQLFKTIDLAWLCYSPATHEIDDNIFAWSQQDCYMRGTPRQSPDNEQLSSNTAQTRFHCMFTINVMLTRASRAWAHLLLCFQFCVHTRLARSACCKRFRRNPVKLIFFEISTKQSTQMMSSSFLGDGDSNVLINVPAAVHPD